jgi:hypothetical protein
VATNLSVAVTVLAAGKSVEPTCKTGAGPAATVCWTPGVGAMDWTDIMRIPLQNIYGCQVIL